MTYSHLPKKFIAYLCRRYGHKKVTDRRDNHCPRCGHRWAHEGNDIVIAYMNKQMMDSLKRASKFYMALNKIPQAKSVTLSFNKWTPPKK